MRCCMYPRERLSWKATSNILFVRYKCPPGLFSHQQNRQGGGIQWLNPAHARPVPLTWHGPAPVQGSMLSEFLTRTATVHANTASVGALSGYLNQVLHIPASALSRSVRQPHRKCVRDLARVQMGVCLLRRVPSRALLR